MGRKVRHHVRQHLIGYLALFVALSGTSYAAARLAPNSVGPRQIQANAVTSPKIKDRSLLAKDFKPGQLPQGAPGRPGQPGILSLSIVESPRLRLQPGQTSYDANGQQVFSADCPAGRRVVGSGFNGSVGHTTFVLATSSFVHGFFYNDSSIAYDVYIQAICAELPAGTASAASSRRERTAAEAKHREAHARVSER